MGNTCDFVQQPGNKYQQRQQDDNPSSSYAIEIINPSEIPCDLTHIRSSYDQYKIEQPIWYAHQIVKNIDTIFYIKRYELYYRGEWKKGVPNGFGQVITKNGQYFKGYFKDGNANGPKCLFVLNNLSYYYGSVQRNKRNGEGIFVDGDYKYQGKWFQNYPSGEGKQILYSGDQYQGTFVRGEKVGQGQYKWRDSDFKSYKGSFNQNEMNGKGQLISRDGIIWKGQFICKKDFIIDKVQCRAEDKIFRGKIKDNLEDQEYSIIVRKSQGRQDLKEQKYQLVYLQNGTYGKGIIQEPIMVFEDKIVTYYNQKSLQKDVRNAIEAIQNGYKDCRKHTQALKNIQRELLSYECRFWKPNEQRQGLVIVPICNKYIQVIEKY